MPSNIQKHPFLSDEYAEDMTAAVASTEASKAMLEQLMGITEIANEEQATLVTDLAKLCKVTHGRVADELKKITGPLRDAEQAARAVASRASEPFVAGEKHAKELLSLWVTKQREIAAQQERDRQKALAEQEEKLRLHREQERERERVAAEGELPLPPAAPPPPPVALPEVTASTTTRGAVSSSSARQIPRFQVVDVCALAAAHPHLLVLKDSAARAALKDAINRELTRGMQRTGVTPTEEVARDAAIAAFERVGLRVTFEDTIVIR